jgi:tripartite-type tricarboxylate transporter receptor subunit TctC
MKAQWWTKRIPVVVAVASIFLFSPVPADAAKFPTRPIRIINPSGAGGSHDLHARAVASVAHEVFGQPMIVQIMTGGGGKEGVMKVVRSKPDGYTLLFTSGSHTTISPIVRKMGYDTRKDLIPIFQINEAAYMMVSMTNKPWANFKAYVAEAKKNPGKISFGSNGIYGNGHLMILKIMADMGIKLNHIPFKGGGPALRAMIGGHTDSAAALPATGSAIGLLKKGKLRILAVAADKRLKQFPTAPTFKEQGVDFTLMTWRTFFVPAKTPPERIALLVDGFKKLIKKKTFKKLIKRFGEQIIPLYGPALVKKFHAEYKRHEEIFSSMGIKKQQ